jgi:hypothetical protein
MLLMLPRYTAMFPAIYIWPRPLHRVHLLAARAPPPALGRPPTDTLATPSLVHIHCSAFHSHVPGITATPLFSRMHDSVLLILVLASSRQLCLASSLLRPSCDLYDHALPSAISSSQYGSFPGHLVPCVRISLVHLSALHSATASWSSFSCFPASWSSYLSSLSSLYAVQHDICYSSMPGATIW